MIELIKYGIVGERQKLNVDTPGMMFSTFEEMEAFRQKIMSEYPEHCVHLTFNDRRMETLFNSELLLERIEEVKKDPPKYYIGVDGYSDDNESSFCLGYKNGDGFIIVLAKTESNKDIFNEEVNNLMKYFNAVKIETRG